GGAADGLVPVAPGADPDERPDEGSIDRTYDRGRQHSVAFLLPHPGAGMLAKQDEVKRYRWSTRVNLDAAQVLCVEVAVLLRADQAQGRAVREAQRLVVETVGKQDILLQGVFDVHDRPVTVEAAEDDMGHSCRRWQLRLDDRLVEGREPDALPAQSDRRPSC